MRTAVKQVKSLSIETLPDVYEPDVDSEMLREAFLVGGPRAHCDVLDVCCGSGVQAIAAAQRGHRVVAVDSERAAINATRRNAAINEVEIEVSQGDLFEPVKGWRFDAILANPPYVPTPDDNSHASWCDGGFDGRAVIDRICSEASSALHTGGKLWMVHSSLADERRTLEMLVHNHFVPRIFTHKLNRLGPVSMARIGHLVEHGHLEPGAQHETLYVIEAVWTG